MFYKNINYVTALAVSIPLLTGIVGCTEGKTLENFLKPDPQLQANSPKSNSEKIETNQPNSSNNNSLPISSEIESKKQITNSNEPKLSEELNNTDFPENFPKTIPIHPQAKLIEVEEINTEEKGKTIWRSPTSMENILTFYQRKFKDNGWEIMQTPANDSPEEDALIAIEDNLEVVLFLNPSSSELDPDSANTEYTLEYQTINNTVEPTVTEESPSNLESVAAISFGDLDETPEQLRQYVEDVAALGILTPYKEEEKVNLTQFAPNKPVTRREYARWLVDINNKFYASSSGNKIHLATKSDEPAFKDIPYNDPDYEIIQGLAEAGLIPSRLTGNSSKLLFQPDAPLTRENLVIWKVPLDFRKALPPASSESISESWGFQDASSIDPQGLRALFADFQNGEQANINRVFGYTTLFQPQKPVTRGEAAASLWYFGFQGEGMNAEEAFKLKEEDS